MERKPYLFLAGSKLINSAPGANCLSLRFDEGVLTVNSTVSCSGFEGSTTPAKAAQALIGCSVLDAYSEQGRLSLDFGGIYLHIALEGGEYSGLEAASWASNDGHIIVIK